MPIVELRTVLAVGQTATRSRTRVVAWVAPIEQLVVGTAL